MCRGGSDCTHCPGGGPTTVIVDQVQLHIHEGVRLQSLQTTNFYCSQTPQDLKLQFNCGDHSLRSTGWSLVVLKVQKLHVVITGTKTELIIIETTILACEYANVCVVVCMCMNACSISLQSFLCHYFFTFCSKPSSYTSVPRWS